MNNLTDKLQQRAIWLKGSIANWDRIIKEEPNPKYLYKCLRERQVNEYEILTGERYK